MEDSHLIVASLNESWINNFSQLENFKNRSKNKNLFYI